MLKTVWSIGLALFCTLPALADYPKPPLEAYGALPQLSAAEISPDGTKVAAILNADSGSRVIVLSVGGGVITQIGIGDMKARDVDFYDDEHVIVRVSETRGVFGFRGDLEYTAAFAFQIATGDADQLLKRAKDLYPGQSGLGKVVGLGERDGEILMPAFIGKASNASPSYDLLRIKIGNSTGRSVSRGSHDTLDWFVGDNGRILARETYNNETNLYRVRAKAKNGWEDVLEIRSEVIPMGIWGVMPDESGLIFVRSTSGIDSGRDELMKLGFDGDISGPIIPPKDREIDEVLTDYNRKVLGVRYAGVEPDHYFLDGALQESYDAVKAALPNATIYLDSWSDDRETLLYQVFDANLGDIWLTHTRSTGALNMVSSKRPDIPVESLGGLLSVEYKARDDLTIQAIITTPPSYDPGQSEPYPAIFLPHGGPAAYDRFDFHWLAQYFANRGYLVVQPNFRGSTGFGRDFKFAGHGEWGGKMQDDITDGVKALVQANMIDPDRVCIVGSSYGGYAALAGAVFTPDLYKCVIAIAPVSDLNEMLETEREDRGKNHWVISYWERFMTDEDARRSKLEAISPVNHAANVQVPVLLLHGDDDLVVPIQQSRLMKQALEKAGKDVEMVILKGEDHWLSVADTRLQTLQAIDAFISQHLPLD